MFASTSQKELDADVQVLIGLLDWLGIAQPVIYGRDWGAIRACKFKIRHPKRAAVLVLEECSGKIDEKEYKARIKADPRMCFGAMGGSWLWFTDGTFPKTMDGKRGKNLQGLKGKIVLLFPLSSNGKHDPKGKSSWIGKAAEMYAKLFNTKYIDSYLLGDDDVAKKITSCFP